MNGSRWGGSIRGESRSNQKDGANTLTESVGNGRKGSDTIVEKTEVVIR